MQNKKLIVILVVSIVVIITAVYLISPDKFSVLRDLSRTIGLEETRKLLKKNWLFRNSKNYRKRRKNCQSRTGRCVFSP